MKKHKNIGVFKSFFMTYRNIYFCLISLFIIGIAIGIVHSLFLTDDIKTDTYNYICTFLSEMKTKQLDMNAVFQEFLIINLKSALCIWIFGLWIIGIPLIYFYIVFEGYSLGFTICNIINCLEFKNGSLFLGLALLPQELVIIPVLLTLGVNSVLFAKAVWKSKNRATNIKFDIYRYIFLFLLSVIILVGVTVIEAYIQIPLLKMVVNKI